MAGEGGLGVASSSAPLGAPKKEDIVGGEFCVGADRMRTGGVIGVKRSYPEKGDQ